MTSAAVEITGFRPDTATADDIAQITSHIYTNKIVVLRDQRLNPSEFAALGALFGTPVPYYEPMYQHPDEPLVFVSSNRASESGSGRRIGVPKTGAFWHADYQFMPKPFAITAFYPQLLPSAGRGTYFIDMAQAYARLDDRLRAAVEHTRCRHSVRRYVKIRPDDVYRPLGAVIDEVERRTPPQTFPTVLTHPVTRKRQLYLSEAFTYAMMDEAGDDLGDLLVEVLAETGQLDPDCTHPNIFLQTYEPGDIVLWDNRTLIHRALHNPNDEPSESFRVTLADEYPLGLEVAP
ncbi:TauD/TfdA family dioxygenase [Gordonia sinesedis]